MGRGGGRGGRRSALQILILGSARKKRRAIGSVEMDLGARRAHCGRRSRKAADHRTAQRQGPSCKQSQALICVSAPGDDKVARPSGAPDQSVVGVRVVVSAVRSPGRRCRKLPTTCSGLRCLPRCRRRPNRRSVYCCPSHRQTATTWAVDWRRVIPSIGRLFVAVDKTQQRLQHLER